MERRKRFYKLESLVKGAANHRRIEMLFLLKRSNGLSTEGTVRELGINYQTGAGHVRRLVRSGLITAYRRGPVVLHELSTAGRSTIAFLEKQ